MTERPSTACPDGPDDAPCTLHEGHDGDHENFYAGTSWACIPAAMNRAERRAHKSQGHTWKTGDPAKGQFCAVCGTSRKGSP